MIDPDVVALGGTNPAQRRQVEAMAAYGIPEREIARVLGLEPTKLRAAFPDELDTGSTKANSKVAESLYRKAIGEGREGVAAAIFWLKARAGWRETQSHGTGSDNIPALIQEPSNRKLAMAVLALLRGARTIDLG